MAEFSMGWPTDGTGDGTSTGYSALQWCQLIGSMLVGTDDLDEYGVFANVGDELEVTNTSDEHMSVASGAALVYWHHYFNDSAVALDLTPPLVDTTGWRIVLRADWTAQEVRATVIMNTDGVPTVPAMTQVAGVTWDIPLASGTITTGKVVTVNDDRKFIQGNLRLDATATGRALIASGYFDEATLLSALSTDSITNAVLLKAIQDGAFQANTNTRALFADGIWTNAKLSSDCKRMIGELIEIGGATLGGSDGRRAVVNGVTYESWVHCDGGASVNGVTIPDLRDKVIAGASATHATGTTGGADTADLSHAHGVGTLAAANESAHTHGAGSYAVNSHAHGAGTYQTPTLDHAMGSPGGTIDDTGSAYVGNHAAASITGTSGGATPGVNGTSGAGSAHTHSLSGSTSSSGSATQDMRQATAYVYRFIYVG